MGLVTLQPHGPLHVKAFMACDLKFQHCVSIGMFATDANTFRGPVIMLTLTITVVLAVMAMRSNAQSLVVRATTLPTAECQQTTLRTGTVDSRSTLPMSVVNGSVQTSVRQYTCEAWEWEPVALFQMRGAQWDRKMSLAPYQKAKRAAGCVLRSKNIACRKNQARRAPHPKSLRAAVTAKW